VRRQITGLALVIIALATTFPARAIGTSTASLSTFPRSLEGVWTRTVTAADIRRAHARHAVTPGVWKMDVGVSKSGTYGNVYITKNGRNVGLGGTMVALGSGHLDMVMGFPSGTAPGPPNNWRWKLSGKRLALTPVRDSNADRIAFFAGVWRKTG
jgi:hypothetical protein